MLGDRAPAEPRDRTLAAGLAESLGEGGISEQPVDVLRDVGGEALRIAGLACHGVEVVERHEQPGLAVDDDLRDPARAGRHDRGPQAIASRLTMPSGS